MIEPTHKVLAFERVSVILNSEIERRHRVVHAVDFDARTEKIGCEDDTPISESDLRIFKGVAVWLLLPAFMAVAEVRSKSGGHLFVAFEITKADTKLSCSRHPYEGRGQRIEVVIQLGSTNAQSAEIIRNHHLVIYRLSDGPACSQAGAIGGPEELIGYVATIDS